jgi:hypothetical protein
MIKSPKYLAGAILSNSKMLMLDFIYNCLWQTYTPDQATILYTDTDSVYVKIRELTPSADKATKYADFVNRFPSDMQTLHFAGPGDLTVGKMKLEKLIDEAVFLKPKTYALRCEDDECHNKGVKVYQNREQHRFEAYKDVLVEHGMRMCRNTNIKRTDKFNGLQMDTLQVDKVGLDAWEDKRLWLDRYRSQPYGLGEQGSLRALGDRLLDNVYGRAQLAGFSGTKIEYLTALGCTKDELEEKMVSKFDVGMCRRNYGTHGWAVDHIVPVSYAKTDDFAALTGEEQAKLRRHIWHCSNMQPLTTVANSAKGGRISADVQARIERVCLE